LLVTETEDGREESIFPEEGIDLDDSNDDNDLAANIEEEEGEANELSTKNNCECVFRGWKKGVSMTTMSPSLRW